MAQASTSFQATFRPSPPQPEVLDPFDEDELQTLALIAKLTLEDIAEIDGCRKGKARADVPLSDEEVAFRTLSEYSEGIVRLLDDRRMAESLREAMEVDHACLRMLVTTEVAARDGHCSALALSEGRDLPRPSQAQRMLEEPAIFEPLNADVEESHCSDAEVAIPPPNGADEHLTETARPLPSHEKGSSSGMKSQPERPRTECAGCLDVIRGSKRFCAPCGHYYCPGCISHLIEACTHDESLYPPRCCTQPFPYESFVGFLTSKVKLVFDAKRVELDVPACNRVYCPTSACSTFLGSSESVLSDLLCEKCGISVCPHCRQPSHWGESCPENAGTIKVLELARKEKWQTCPGCHAIVELNVGCYHIVCRCGTGFCYLCAVPWKHCACRQWDERQLLETAQRRVEQEMGGPVGASAFRERVLRMADTLREDHDCPQHTWRSRRGSAQCEECYHVLPEYIMVCSRCHLTACRRCARNRL